MAAKTYHFVRAESGVIVQLDISKEYLKRMEFYQISYISTIYTIWTTLGRVGIFVYFIQQKQ